MEHGGAAMRALLWSQHDRLRRAATGADGGRLGPSAAPLTASGDMGDDAVVDDTVHRLVDGRYGRCLECGGAIPPERLRMLPTPHLCRACDDVVARAREVLRAARARTG